MLIECKIKRKNGSRIRVGGQTYHFKPETEGGPHVCEVTNRDHVGRLLSIREGYRIAGDEAEEAPELAGDQTVNPNEDSAESEDRSTDGEDTGDSAESEGAGGEGDETPEDSAESEEPLDREALAQEYQERFGSRPHGKWSAQRIRDELADEPGSAGSGAEG